MPDWSEQAVQDYLGRLPRDFGVTVKPIRAEPRRQQPVARILQAESARLREALTPADRVIALDERGADWTTERLARQIDAWRSASEHVAFVIGGPDGLADSIKSSADLLLRLSSLTLPHALARVVLAEQLYRAWSILANHPYHRG